MQLFNSKSAFFTNTVQIGGYDIITSDLILRTIVLVYGIVALGLTIASITDKGINNSSAHFAIYASAFSIVYGFIFGTFANFCKRIKPTFVLITDVLNMLFTFAGGVALAHFSQKCSKKHKHCSVGKAGATFLFFLFFLFIGLVSISIVSTIDFYKKSKEGNANDEERSVKSNSQQVTGKYLENREMSSNPFADSFKN